MNTLLVGGGRGGLAMINMFCVVPEVNIIGVVEINTDAPGAQKAKSMGIPIYADLVAALNLPDLEVVANVTGREEINNTIMEHKPPQVHLADSFICKLMYQLAQFQESQDAKLRNQVTDFGLYCD